MNGYFQLTVGVSVNGSLSLNVFSLLSWKVVAASLGSGRDNSNNNSHITTVAQNKKTY